MANKGTTGSAGRFGARYGRVARRRVAEIEADTEGAQVDGEDVKRVGTGIWINEETGEKFTGGAYRPQTPAGKTVTRSIRAALGDEDVETDIDTDAPQSDADAE
jgi:large subunit ribosomal protein L37Ae